MNLFTYLLTYLLTPRSTVLLEKLTGSRLVKKFPHFMEPEGSLPLSQAPATCPYPERDRFTPCPHIPLPADTSQYYIPIYAYVFQVICFPRVSPLKPCTHLSSPPIHATCPAHLILLDFITRIALSEQYRSLSSSLCSYLHSPITSSLLDANISISNPFSNTFSLRSSVFVSD